MECQDMLELLSASLDGELTKAEQTQLNAHLDICPSCRALYEELSGLHAACALETEVPAELTERILASLPPQRSGKVVYWKRWGAMAAAVVLIALAAWRLPQHLPAGAGSDSTRPETSEEAAVLTAAMMDEAVPAETGDAQTGTSAPAYGAFSRSAPVDQAPNVDTGTGSIDTAPAAAEQAPVNGAQDPAAPGQSPDSHGQNTTDVQQSSGEAGQAAGKRALTAPFSAPIPDPGTDTVPSAVLFTAGPAPDSESGGNGTSDAFDETAYPAVPEDVPEVPDNERFITTAPFEDIMEDIRDFSSYRYVLTLSQADFAQDYPQQLQSSGEMWYLVPLEVLEALPQTLAEEDPLYALRDQGEDLDANSSYALVVVPPAS